MLIADHHRESEIARGSTEKDVVIALAIERYGKFIIQVRNTLFLLRQAVELPVC